MIFGVGGQKKIEKKIWKFFGKHFFWPPPPIVNRALQARIYETIQQKRNLEVKLSETESEFHKAEQNAVRIDTALKDIVPPMQVKVLGGSKK